MHDRALEQPEDEQEWATPPCPHLRWMNIAHDRLSGTVEQMCYAPGCRERRRVRTNTREARMGSGGLTCV